MNPQDVEYIDPMFAAILIITIWGAWLLIVAKEQREKNMSNLTNLRYTAILIITARRMLIAGRIARLRADSDDEPQVTNAKADFEMVYNQLPIGVRIMEEQRISAPAQRMINRRGILHFAREWKI